MIYKYSDCCDALLIETKICPKCSEYCTPMVECPNCANLPRHLKDEMWKCMICSGTERVAAGRELGGSDGVVAQ